MPKKDDKAHPASAFRAALSGLLENSARDFRVVSARRAEIGKLLAGKDMRRLADEDDELSTQLGQVSEALTEEERAAAGWQKALAEATKRWEASLTELSKLHPGDI